MTDFWLKHVSLAPKVCTNILWQKLLSQTVIREKLRRTLLYKKAALEMLVKLTPRVNFTKILQAASTSTDTKSAKKTVKSSVSFCTFGICLSKSCL